MRAMSYISNPGVVVSLSGILQELQVGLIPELLSEAGLKRSGVDKEIAVSYGLGFRIFALLSY